MARQPLDDNGGQSSREFLPWSVPMPVLPVLAVDLKVKPFSGSFELSSGRDLHQLATRRLSQP